MEIDRWLSKLSRLLNRRVSTGRRLRRLREWCSRRYADRDDRWAVISDYRDRLKLKLDRSAYMGSSIYWHGWHHGRELAYLENVLRPDGVFIDAGANIGEFTVAAAARVTSGRVLAFEPQPDVRAILEENVALNGFSNVTVFPFGLAEVRAKAKLFTSMDVTRFGSFNEGLYTRFPDENSSVSAGEVEFLSLDDVLKEHSVGRVDWIKVDIEGGELFLLKGARHTLSTARPGLLLEINEAAFRAAGYTVRELADLLSSLNYRWWRLEGNQLVPCDWRQAGGISMNVFLLPEES